MVEQGRGGRYSTERRRTKYQKEIWICKEEEVEKKS